MSSKKPWIVAALVVVALAVVAVVASGGGGGDDDPSMAVTADVTSSGRALPRLTDGGADPAVGSAAPQLEGSTFEGTPITITPGDGKATIVLFVAHWCPHCRREVPFLVRHLGEQPLPDDVDLVTVSTAVDADAPNYPPHEWLAEERWDLPVMADSEDGTAAEAYGLSSFPYFVALRADGTVAARVTGELTAEQFDALVAAARR